MLQDESKLKFLEKLLGKSKYNSSSKEAQFFCPFCDHRKAKFYVNLESDLYNCYYSKCNKRGVGLYSLIKKLGTREDLEKYNSHYRAKNVRTKEEVKFERIFLPKEYIPLCCSNSVIIQKLKSYLEKRGLKEEEIIKYKLGTCIGGDYNEMIIFPSFDKDGDVNYFTAKNLRNGQYYIPPTQKGYKNSVIINELNIDFTKPLLIVEGFFDAISSGMVNVAPLLGSTLSPRSKLFGQIVKNRTPVFLALDPDAKEKSLKIAEKFVKYDVMVYNIDVEPYKDVGEMSRSEFAIAYQNGTLLQEMDILRKKILMSA